MLALLFKGFSLGVSVALPPGPISAEMVRPGLERGFLPAWALGLGACSGDFLWAVAVSLGAGALIKVPGVSPVLGASEHRAVVVPGVDVRTRRVGGVDRQPDAGGALARISHPAVRLRSRRLRAGADLGPDQPVEHRVLDGGHRLAADGEPAVTTGGVARAGRRRGGRRGVVEHGAVRARPHWGRSSPRPRGTSSRRASPPRSCSALRCTPRCGWLGKA